MLPVPLKLCTWHEVVALLLLARTGQIPYRRQGPSCKRPSTSGSGQVQQSFIVLQGLPVSSLFSLPSKDKPTAEPGSLGLGPVILGRLTILVGGPVGVKFRQQVRV